MFGDADFLKAIRLEHPDVIPTTVGLLPAFWIRRGRDAEELVKAFPQFFPQGYSVDWSDPSTIAHGTYRAGEHVDEWGCVWSNVNEGMEAIVTGHPVRTEEDVFTLEIPKNRDGRMPHGFMYLRLLDLCGFDNAMYLFGDEDEAIEVLVDKVLQYNVYQVEALIDKFTLLQAAQIASVPTFLQKAAETALQVDVQDMAAVYRKRREYVLDRLDAMGLTYPRPEGAFYVFPEISKFGMDSETFCIRLIEEGGLAAVPGSCFGGEGHIRLSYCYSDEELQESLDRLEKFIQNI